jgi:LPXTG-motif cell wall-anchored protein
LLDGQNKNQGALPMKKFVMSLLAFLVVFGLIQPAQAAGKTAFYDGVKVTHADGGTDQPFAKNEKLMIDLAWSYKGSQPAEMTLPDKFKLNEDVQKVLTTKDGTNIGMVKVDAKTRVVMVSFVNAAAIESGTSGTIFIPVVFNEAKVTAAGTYDASFNIGQAAPVVVKMTVVNAAETGTGVLKIMAVDASTKAKVAGSAFTVVNSAGKVVASLTTNSMGEATAPNLLYGTYTVTQTAAQEGYAVSADPWKVDVNAAVVTKEVMHSKMTGLTGSLTITAVEKGTKTPINAAEFELKSEDGLFSKTVVTDDKGVAALTGLAYGAYTLKQTKTAEDFVLPTETWGVVIGRQTPIEKTIENQLINEYGILSIKKTDEKSGDVLKGAEFSLYYYTGDQKLVAKVVTDNKGTAEFKNLAAGKYTLQETKAPTGYTRSSEKTVVTIKSGETIELTLKNTKSSTTGAATTTSGTKSANTLPRTGDESSELYMLGFVLLAAGAFMLMKKGKRA